jgi:aminopeptidase N
MGIRRARAAIVVAAFMACTLLTTTLASAGTAGQPAGHTGGNGRCHAGAAGVGDDYYPLYGNGGYDVAHYLLKVSYEPATNRLVGVATIFARATENLCSFNLDFQGMTVRSVVVDGKRAAWSRSQDHELTVKPGHALRKGRRFTTVVRYDGVPRTQQIILGPDFSIEAGFMHTDDGAVIAGEPEVAANWFPVNDHPIDKASYTFVVTVPAGLEVVGNGRLVAHTTHGRLTTWIWNAPEPMASYLATATMGQFDLHTYRTASGLRMYDAIDPDLFKEQVDPDDPASPTFGEIAEGSLARQGEILDFLSQQFGTPYPFSTGGGIVDDYDNLLFALENQTRTVYSKFFFTDSISGDSVVVHENAHQWFGDSVALAEWKHVWLNEGFATYAEWLWSQHENLGTTQEIFDALYNGIPADDPLWQVVIGDPTVTFLFDNAVYLRGAMTLQVLRNQVGDRDFFRILRAWARTKAGGNGTTDQFIALAERISGQQLDDLFQTWLFTAGKPALDAVGATQAAARVAATASGGAARIPPAAAMLLERISKGVSPLRR